MESTWDLLGSSCTTRFIRDKNLVIGYRRPKNLRDILVRIRLPPENDPESQTTTRSERPICNTTNCCYCSRLNVSSKIRSKTTNKMHNAMRNVNCYSNNLIYCFSCTKCGKQYVGQTKNSLRRSFVSHFYLIGHKKTEHEGPRHFNVTDHRGIHDVEIDVLEFIKSNCQKNRNQDLQTKKRVLLNSTPSYPDTTGNEHHQH